MNLYPDQLETVEDVRAAMRASKSVLLQSPTGSGKTRIATYIIDAAKNKDSRIIFTVPRKDLLEQTHETFKELGIQHSFIAAGKSYNPFAKVHIGMIDTMARRTDRLPSANLVIFDETHYGAGSLDAVINHYKKSGSYLLGLSGTPWKLSGHGLGCWYETMVKGRTIKWLIDNKRLSDYRYFYGRTNLDLSGIKITAGDYAKGEVASFMEEKAVIVGDAVRDYKERCMGNLHMVRCASIKHSMMTADAFRSAGISSVHVDGETPMDERKRIFRAYAMREIQVVCFVNLLEFGFDLSQASGGMDVCIESGSDLKPSRSLAAQMQFWGRMLRYKSQAAIFHDHVNNHKEHGLPCDDREWTLADRDQSKRASSERALATKQCEKCFYVHSPAPSCPNCGNIYEIKGREIDEVDGALTEMSREDRDAARAAEIIARKTTQAQAKTLEQLIEEGKRRGMKNPRGWARHVYTARMAKNAASS